MPRKSAFEVGQMDRILRVIKKAPAVIYLTFIHIESIVVHTIDARLHYLDTEVYIDDILLNKTVHENKNNSH